MFKIRSVKRGSGSISNAEVCRAVSGRLMARCVYGDGGERLIEPHCHGHSQAGHEVLSAFQVSGPPGAAAGWKMFDVGKLAEFEVTGECFQLRPDFNADQPGMTHVHCLAKTE